MTWQGVVSDFAGDPLLKAVGVLIVLDVALGVVAAGVSKTQRFDFQRLSDFLRNDVVGKVLPWFIVFSISKFETQNVLGVDLDLVQKGVFVAVSVALLGSLATSLSDLGFKQLDAIPGIGPERAP